MAKIVLSFYNLGLGGIQTKIVDIANKMNGLGHQIVVVVDKKSYGLVEKSFFLNKDIIIYEAQSPVTTFFFDGFYYSYLFFFILFFKPAAVFLSLDETPIKIISFFSLLPFYRKPKIIINVDTFLSLNSSQATQKITKYFNRSDAVIAVSSDTYLDLRYNFNIREELLHKIYNWVDASNVSVDSFEKNKKDIVFAGRFESQKRPHYILFFLFLLRQKNISASVEMYGSGSLFQLLLGISKKLGLQNNVSFFRPVANIEPILKKRKYLLLSSSFEGLPFIALEAIRSGCVVLCLDAPGLRDVIVDGVTGFRKNSLKDLVEVYQHLERDPQLYAKIQSNALSHLKKNFSTGNMDKIIQLLISQ